MHLKSIKIKNLRALEDIFVELDTRVSVIVGPNAAGKTTILEAVRLVKSLLAPRTSSESAHVLQALGASSPHMPNRFRFAALARDPAKDTVIGCRFRLSSAEIGALGAGHSQLTTSVVRSRLGQNFSTPDALINLLATPQGKQLFATTHAEVDTALARIRQSNECYLEVTISPEKGINASSDAMEMQFVGFLDQRLPPYKTSFTYFPADRALPAGEQPVQLGGPDAAQQLESYNSQPHIKFTRLKNAIFSASILGTGTGPNELQKDFEDIFSGILKGRELDRLGINEIGMLSVLIKDTDTGRVFDLDGMSSGEKGLILTFLLISRSMENDGMILLDEPELHLNPAVCKDLLSFMIDKYAKPRNLQLLVCSHSAEILAGTFDNDECALYHLVSPTVLSKVRPQDEATLGNALRRLGTGESETLLYRGIVFVEGPDDVALLDAGFPGLLRRYKLKSSTGRREIEKAIHSLQEAEGSGAAPLITQTYFVFDLDDEPTSLRSSSSVGVLQWDRRCLENYLIDQDAIADLLMSREIMKAPLSNAGEVGKLLRQLAFGQLDEIAARRVYARTEFEGFGIRRSEIAGKDVATIAKALSSRLERISESLQKLDVSTWQQRFVELVQAEKAQLEGIWETQWKERCDGKRLFEDLIRTHQMNIGIKRFKVRLMKEIAIAQGETWKLMDSQLRKLLSA
ncbi:MAG TPA: AAA family ATPase [Steroidobacteraceae bacterium]|nr:AAA family ATPase [Steroidobacteraceae bacterium]